jgi:cyclophilin family peptidyl-prolyl cis-trans isomerase
VKNLAVLVFTAVLVFGGVVFLFRPSGGEVKVSPTPAPTQTPSSTKNTSETNSPAMYNSKNMEKPQLIIDKTKTYQAVLETTEGQIVIDLTADKTPITVNNFVYLGRAGFYDGTIFHRVVEGFMIQGGDPIGNGTGGPGYRFDDEKFDGSYTRGTVAMANAGPNTNGSQFFIMHADYPLPKDYVIFGKVSKGMEVVDKIASAETINQAGEKSKPVNPVKINKATIVEK